MFITPNGTNTYTLANGFTVNGSGVVTVYFVDGGAGNESNDGLSWANAKKSIQSAVDAASNNGGGQVWVKSGTYKPTTGTDREISFIIKQNVELYGGFNGTETALEQRDCTTNRCVLSGDIGTPNNNSDNSYHVVVTQRNARIDGFSITDGNANGDRLLRTGGGIYMANDKAHIENNRFFDNYAEEGAAMYIFNINGATASSRDIVTIKNCSFYSNSANLGGAIVLRVGASSNIDNCSFANNMAEWRGGAIFIDYGAYTNAPITISKSSFSDNSTNGNGGAIYSDDMASQHQGTYWFVQSCSFSGNTATYRGGAIANYNSNNFTTIENNSFANNTAGAGGSAIASNSGVSLTVNNNLLNSGQDIDTDAESSCNGNNCP